MSPHTDMKTDTEALLDAAEDLFYARGYQAVGMDALRTASHLSLKRIYAIFASKDDIALTMLERRDQRWRTSLTRWVNTQSDPKQRVLAVFD
jgi:AcrR family transcriptional regulator